MQTFAAELRRRNPRAGDRRTVFVAPDQLHDGLGPLARHAPRELRLVLVETPAKAARRPYHRQKLALVLANLRHFALEQAERGVRVEHLVDARGYAPALRDAAARCGPLLAMEPAERELRRELAPLADEGLLQPVPHDGWLTTREQFLAGAGARPPWRMDAFYRHVRAATGVLMQPGPRGPRPAGGRWSFDAETRRPWRGTPPAPPPPRFPPDAVTREVGELVLERFARHPGTLDLEALPATARDAATAWSWALREALPHFGPFEDALSAAEPGLFHARVAPLLNLHRLLPREVLAAAAAAPAPLASREGFVRQVLGWREFVRHVHRETDGLRRLPGGDPACLEAPGDGGWSRAHGAPWPRAGGDGGACPDHLGAGAPLPPAFWGRPSGLACLDTVVARAWRHAWTHHTERLMVLANLATLLGASPRELADWFWCAYADAFDWVVEPNVLAMGSFATGPLMTGKPYVCGAAYLRRMSDFCGGCRFDPRRDCPLTPLYWYFLDRAAPRLAGNPRMAQALRAAARRAPERRLADATRAAALRAALARGEELRPD